MSMELWALLISLVALATSVASAWYTRQQALGTTAQADEAKRANDREDAVREAAAEVAALQVERDRFRWDLVRVAPNQHQLQNRGTDDAHDVVVTATNAVLLRSGAQVDEIRSDFLRVGAKVGLVVVGAGSNGGPAELNVSWLEGNQTVILPLP